MKWLSSELIRVKLTRLSKIENFNLKTIDKLFTIINNKASKRLKKINRTEHP